MSEAKKIIDLLSMIHSSETNAIRIDRTALKQWQKSEQLRRQVAEYGEPDKWEAMKRPYKTYPIIKDAKAPTLTDDLFFQEIQKYYPGINIERELGKMRAFLLTPKAKGRKLTRRFVVAWLNRCDVPIKGQGVSGEKRSAAYGYSNKLKDPRWQRKRLEVLNYAGFHCQLCGEGTKPLHVHHSHYDGREPWDYPLGMLICLCEACHHQHHNKKEEKFTKE